jgi:DoxX-like family
MTSPIPPSWLIHVAVAAVWFYEGLWCKLLGGEKRQLAIVASVPRVGPAFGEAFLKALGAVEVGIGAWALSAIAPVPCAIAQTLLLATLNASGILLARRLIQDPGGMVVKNVAFLVLVWVSASLPPHAR